MASEEIIKEPVAAEANEQTTAVEVAHNYTWAEMAALEKAATESPEAGEKFETAKSEFLLTMGVSPNFDFMNEVENLCERQKILFRSKMDFQSNIGRQFAAMSKSFKDAIDKINKQIKSVGINVNKCGYAIVDAVDKEIKKSEKAQRGVGEGIATLAADVGRAVAVESVFTKPFSWPRYIPEEMQSFIPKIDRQITDENAFVFDISNIIEDDSPRKVIDALTQIAIQVADSIASLKSKMDGLAVKCKRNSGCSAAEVKLAQSFRKKFAANIEAQEHKLMLVNKIHTKVCASLIKCARAYHEKFYEELSAKGHSITKLEIGKEAL